MEIKQAGSIYRSYIILAYERLFAHFQFNLFILSSNVFAFIRFNASEYDDDPSLLFFFYCTSYCQLIYSVYPWTCLIIIEYFLLWELLPITIIYPSLYIMINNNLLLFTSNIFIFLLILSQYLFFYFNSYTHLNKQLTNIIYANNNSLLINNYIRFSNPLIFE